jgi:lipopolysaccharide biosynthesis regulator YciM
MSTKTNNYSDAKRTDHGVDVAAHVLLTARVRYVTSKVKHQRLDYFKLVTQLNLAGNDADAERVARLTEQVSAAYETLNQTRDALGKLQGLLNEVSERLESSQ